jgi:hypothetical protein
VAGALLVGLLSANVLRSLPENPVLPPEIHSQVDLDSINFVSNDRLQSVMERTTATPQQVVEAVHINTESRLRALKTGLLIMAGLRATCDHPGRRAAGLHSRRSAERSTAADRWQRKTGLGLIGEPAARKLTVTGHSPQRGARLQCLS